MKKQKRNGFMKQKYIFLILLMVISLNKIVSGASYLSEDAYDPGMGEPQDAVADKTIWNVNHHDFFAGKRFEGSITIKSSNITELYPDSLIVMPVKIGDYNFVRLDVKFHDYIDFYDKYRVTFTLKRSGGYPEKQIRVLEWDSDKIQESIYVLARSSMEFEVKVSWDGFWEDKDTLFYKKFYISTGTGPYDKVTSFSSVAENVVNSSGQDPRTKNYALIKRNPVDGARYEFMLTQDGRVIFNKGNQGWKYFGTKGYDLKYIDDPLVDIGPFDVIAADGNRIFAKKKNSNTLYFAHLANDHVFFNKSDDSFDWHPGTFLSTNPGTYRNASGLINNDYLRSHGEIFADIAHDDKISMMFKDVETAIPVIGDWRILQSTRIVKNWRLFPVVVLPFRWYRLNAEFDMNLEENQGAEIVDIGVFHYSKKFSRDLAIENNYDKTAVLQKLYQFGGEYHRNYGQPIKFGNQVLFDGANNPYLVV